MPLNPINPINPTISQPEEVGFYLKGQDMGRNQLKGLRRRDPLGALMPSSMSGEIGAELLINRKALFSGKIASSGYEMSTKMSASYFANWRELRRNYSIFKQLRKYLVLEGNHVRKA